MQSVLIAVLAALQKTEFMIKTLCTHVFLGNTSTQLTLAERTVHADGLTEQLAVGGVTNMYVIAEKMLNAGNVVKP